MSVSLREIELKSSNPARFTDPYEWRVMLDVHEQLPDDLEFKVVWIGSSRTSKNDQIIEDCEVGPLAVGANELVLEHNAPDWTKIPPEDLLDVTFICLLISYHGKEFMRVSYFVNMALQRDAEEPTGSTDYTPQHVDIQKLCRNVLLSKPQIKASPIDWGTPQGGDESMSGFPAAGMPAGFQPIQAGAHGASRSAATAPAEQSRGTAMDMDGNSQPGFTHSAPAVMSTLQAGFQPPQTQPHPSMMHPAMRGMAIDSLPCPGASPATPSCMQQSIAPVAAPPFPALATAPAMVP